MLKELWTEGLLEHSRPNYRWQWLDFLSLSGGRSGGLGLPEMGPGAYHLQNLGSWETGPMREKKTCHCSLGQEDSLAVWLWRFWIQRKNQNLFCALCQCDINFPFLWKENRKNNYQIHLLPSIHFFICSSLPPSTHPTTYPSIYHLLSCSHSFIPLSIHPPIHSLSIQPSIHPSTHQSVYPLINLPFIHPSTHLFICPSIHSPFIHSSTHPCIISFISPLSTNPFTLLPTPLFMHLSIYSFILNNLPGIPFEYAKLLPKYLPNMEKIQIEKWEMNLRFLNHEYTRILCHCCWDGANDPWGMALLFGISAETWAWFRNFGGIPSKIEK